MTEEDEVRRLLGSKEAKRFLESLEDLEIQKPLADAFKRQKQAQFDELVAQKGLKGSIRRFFFYEKFRKELVLAVERVQFIERVIRAHGIIFNGICTENPLHLEAISMLLQILIEKVEYNKNFFEDIPHSSSLGVLNKAKELRLILERQVKLLSM